MGSTNIAGCAVNVENQGAHGCSFNDSVFVISGEGAEKLRRVCERYGFEPGPLENSQFIVEGKKRDFFSVLGDSPAAQQLADRLLTAGHSQTAEVATTTAPLKTPPRPPSQTGGKSR